jgi:hypothetical protein
MNSVKNGGATILNALRAMFSITMVIEFQTIETIEVRSQTKQVPVTGNFVFCSYPQWNSASIQYY